MKPEALTEVEDQTNHSDRDHVSSASGVETGYRGSQDPTPIHEILAYQGVSIS